MQITTIRARPLAPVRRSAAQLTNVQRQRMDILRAEAKRACPIEIQNDKTRFDLIIEFGLRAEQANLHTDNLFEYLLPAFFEKCSPEAIKDPQRLKAYLDLILSACSQAGEREEPGLRDLPGRLGWYSHYSLLFLSRFCPPEVLSNYELFELLTNLWIKIDALRKARNIPTPPSDHLLFFFQESSEEILTNPAYMRIFLRLGHQALEKGVDPSSFFAFTLPSFLKNCPAKVLSDPKKLETSLTTILNIGLQAKQYAKKSDAFFRLVTVLSVGQPAFLFPEAFSHFFASIKSREDVLRLLEALKDLGCLYVPLNKDNLSSLQALRISMVKFLRQAKIKTLADVKRYNLASLSPALLREAGVRQKVEVLLKREFPTLPEIQTADDAAFVATAARLLEHKAAVLADPNIEPIFEAIRKHGDIATYYRKQKPGILRKLRAAGFNVGYLLSGKEVLRRSRVENGNGSRRPWPQRLDELIVQLLGSRRRNLEPRAQFSFNSPANLGKTFGRIDRQGNFRKALAGDKTAAKVVISNILNIVSDARGAETRPTPKRILEEFHDLFSGLMGELEYDERTMGAEHVWAQRSPKLVPQILFDNARLACCIFKPEGQARDEISLILLDPKTPLLEFWMEGYPEFMAVATQYLGKNRENQPVVFVDTFEGNEAVYQLGRNFGLKFAVDALIADAKRLGARQVVIYKCPFGKPLEFVNFVRDLASKNGYSAVIKEQRNYHFEAVDFEDEALADSRGAKHHYTDAFGENAKLMGKKDCYVIDVAQYYEQFLKEAA